MKRIAVLMAAACLALAGCGKGPEPEGPEIPERPTGTNSSFLIESVHVKVDADEPAAIEADLAADTGLAGKGGKIVVHGDKKWEFLRADGTKIVGGSFRNVKTEEASPVFALLPAKTTVIGMQKWTFVGDNGDEREYYMYIVRPENKQIRMSLGPRYSLRFYEDLTDHYKAKYPDAGVRSVARVQISNEYQN